MTTIQKITIGLIIAYLIWELIVKFWAKNESGPIIRADLFFIYPVLGVFVLISLFQLIRKMTGGA
jgi:hypothetical protein